MTARTLARLHERRELSLLHPCLLPNALKAINVVIEEGHAALSLAQAIDIGKELETLNSKKGGTRHGES